MLRKPTTQPQPHRPTQDRGAALNILRALTESQRHFKAGPLGLVSLKTPHLGTEVSRPLDQSLLDQAAQWDIDTTNFVLLSEEELEESFQQKENENHESVPEKRKLSAEELMLLNCGVGEDS